MANINQTRLVPWKNIHGMSDGNVVDQHYNAFGWINVSPAVLTYLKLLCYKVNKFEVDQIFKKGRGLVKLICLTTVPLLAEIPEEMDRKNHRNNKRSQRNLSRETNNGVSGI